MTPEAKVKAKAVRLIKEHDAWYCFPVATGYGTSGVPDILVCVNGRFVGIECKVPGGQPTALQQKQLDAIHAAGGAAIVFRGTDGDLQTLKKFLTDWR